MITFITALIKTSQYENTGEQLHHFVALAMTGLNICIYLSPEYERDINNMIEFFPNIKIMGVYELYESYVYKLYNQTDPLPELPSQRNESKDTVTAILSSHIKHEWIANTIDLDPWKSTHFAWVDIPWMERVHNKIGMTQYLKGLSMSTLTVPYLTFPGCWNKLEKDKIQDVLNSVHWRFCGGFFIGDALSMSTFCKLHREQLPLFFKEYQKVVWDFNFWAWMETYCEDKWSPIWYRGDHNDSLFMMSADLYTRPLNSNQTITYSYPEITHYYPTSAAYLYTGGKHILNTRYVNYWIYPNGYYLFHSGSRLIENKNLLSELNKDTLIPEYYKEIREQIDLPVIDGISKGIEDIRLYEINNVVKYIATTVGYSPSGKSRMIIGNYDIENASITDGTIIHPPYDTWSEKNWIPIIRNKEELFIYKWSPMEIGKIDYEKKELIIVQTHTIYYPLFHKIRGSTIFQEIEEGLLGVVHFSEEHTPRHYYHMLVLLDKNTLAPIRFTESFCFEKLGIEFCVGFAVKSDHYIFWISRHDRDPITIKLPRDNIKWII